MSDPEGPVELHPLVAVVSLGVGFSRVVMPGKSVMVPRQGTMQREYLA